jgi:hypothetical protein
MMTPVNAKYIDEAKENRLSYLASIPIASFNDKIDFDDEDEDRDDEQKQKTKSKSPHNVRFNLSSPSPPPSLRVRKSYRNNKY